MGDAVQMGSLYVAVAGVMPPYQDSKSALFYKKGKIIFAYSFY